MKNSIAMLEEKQANLADRTMMHINALREDNLDKMKEIFDKFDIVKDKLLEIDSEGVAKMGVDEESDDTSSKEIFDHSPALNSFGKLTESQKSNSSHRSEVFSLHN